MLCNGVNDETVNAYLDSLDQFKDIHLGTIVRWTMFYTHKMFLVIFNQCMVTIFASCCSLISQTDYHRHACRLIY